MSRLCGILFLVFMCLCVVNECSGRRADSRLLRRHKRFIEWGPDIAGPYCETRPDGCCPGRIDECSVPILDTLCYCDMFCNRTRGDCCPDFFTHCFDQPKPPNPNIVPDCKHDGNPYKRGQRIKINCQQCTCAPDQRTASGYSFRCDGEICLVRDEIIDRVNSGNLGWRASNYTKFWGMTLRDGMRYRLGTTKPDSLVASMNPIKIQHDGRLPENFDARTRWPGWVHGVRDQGNCASSWAFSTTALASDRLTIESRGAAPDRLSTQHLLSCNSNRQSGCDGGSLDRAWWYLRKYGVTLEDCYPYRSGSTDVSGSCQISRGQTSGICPSGIPFTRERVYQATPPYRIAMKEKDIMAEIEMNGPVQATFQVKEDFYLYRSGVYSHSRAVPESYPREANKTYHSVRIIGWGLDRTGRRNTKYWLCANSWGEDWGERGYFRITRGTNECDIESFVLGAWGKVVGDEELRTLLTTFRRERQRERDTRKRVAAESKRRRRRRHLKRKSKKNRRRRHLKSHHRD